MSSPPRIYLITGATGIAAATAKLAASRGAHVFMVSNTREQLEALAEEIVSARGACDFCVADVTAASDVGRAVGECVELYGRIDALYNVAGISGRRFGDGPVHECTEEGWDATLETNLKSVFLMCRATTGQMLRQPVDQTNVRGTILNMASVLAFAPERRFFATHAYAASKGAIIALTKSMAAYYAPHQIRINAIAPALVRTPMSARAQENTELLDYMKLKQPLAERMIEADDVARASLFLLGDESRMMTGDVLTVDAGWSISG